MPSRTKSNVSGDLGELRVISDFVKMGAAVNSLSQSDYGWDAHVHTPEDVLDMDNLPKKSWKMLGLSAHIQVKNAESGSAAYVKVGSLRAWLAGVKGRYADVLLLRSGQAEIRIAEDAQEDSLGQPR